MGEDYQNQVFFDFESGTIVKTSQTNSWDLAFESGGDHVFINGGKGLYVYNTHETDASFFTNAYFVQQQQWQYDAACGLPDSTAVGVWRSRTGASKGEVFLVKMNDETFRKFVIVRADADQVTLAHGVIDAQQLDTVMIPKNTDYNYSYFSLEKGVVLQPEPPKATWDIVFTRYRHIYYDLQNFPYLVTGALINPYETSGIADSSMTWEEIDYDDVANHQFSNFRNVIGYDWKKFVFDNNTGGKYHVLSHKNYIIRTSSGNVWKLRFLDFYSPDGVKGYPSFEYERIQ